MSGPIPIRATGTDKQLGDNVRRLVTALEEELAGVIVGQRNIVRGVLTALLAGGHVLLEGVPGLGKTLLVRTLAECVDLSYSRIQFTPDLMPADIVGTDIITEGSEGRGFTFQPRPIFAHLILADEINRATPRTQSAMLEAMQEHAVTVGRETHRLPQPFFVLATQNPIDLQGTYPLPEAQLDRFFFKLLVGYPTPDELKEIARRTTGNREQQRRTVVMDAETLHGPAGAGARGAGGRAGAGLCRPPGHGDPPGPAGQPASAKQLRPLWGQPPRHPGPRAGGQSERHPLQPLQRLHRRPAPGAACPPCATAWC